MSVQKHARFFAASLVYTGLSGTYADVLEMPSDIRGAALFNGTDVDVTFSFDDGTSDTIVVPAGQNIFLDFVAMDMIVAKSTIQAKENASASSGSVSVTVVY